MATELEALVVTLGGDDKQYKEMMNDARETTKQTTAAITKDLQGLSNVGHRLTDPTNQFNFLGGGKVIKETSGHIKEAGKAAAETATDMAGLSGVMGRVASAGGLVSIGITAAAKGLLLYRDATEKALKWQNDFVASSHKLAVDNLKQFKVGLDLDLTTKDGTAKNAVDALYQELMAQQPGIGHTKDDGASPELDAAQKKLKNIQGEYDAITQAQERIAAKEGEYKGRLIDTQSQLKKNQAEKERIDADIAKVRQKDREQSETWGFMRTDADEEQSTKAINALYAQRRELDEHALRLRKDAAAAEREIVQLQGASAGKVQQITGDLERQKAHVDDLIKKEEQRNAKAADEYKREQEQHLQEMTDPFGAQVSKIDREYRQRQEEIDNLVGATQEWKKEQSEVNEQLRQAELSQLDRRLAGEQAKGMVAKAPQQPNYASHVGITQSQRSAIMAQGQVPDSTADIKAQTKILGEIRGMMKTEEHNRNEQLRIARDQLREIQNTAYVPLP